jgi:hypothetical protein
MDSTAAAARASRLADRLMWFCTVQVSFSDIIARLDHINEFPVVETIELCRTFFKTASLNQYPQCDEVRNFLFTMLQCPETFATGASLIDAILCQPGFEMPEEHAEELLGLLRPAIEAGAREEAMIPVLAVLEYVCGTHPELFTLAYPLQLWCAVLQFGWPPNVVYGLLRVLAREIRTSKSDMTVTAPEFSMALVGVLDAILLTAGQEKKVMSAVVDLALAFATRNVCWLTFFGDAQLLERLFGLFTRKSSTMRVKLLKLAEEAYKLGSDPDILDVSFLISSFRHTVSCIQSAAINCIITYIRHYPSRLPRLVELGLCPALLEVLGEGAFGIRCHSIDLLAELVISDETMIEVFLGNDLIAAILPLMRGSADSRRVTSLLTVLKRIRNFCVVHGHGRLFIEKFDECEGFEVIEQMAKDVRDFIVAEEARIFVEEVTYLEKAVQ